MFDFLFGIFSSATSTILVSSKGTFKKEIENNIKFLAHEKWFQAYLNHDIYHKIIIENKKVRRIIGLINTKKMVQSSYHKKQQKKIDKVIKQQTKRDKYSQT